MERTTPWLVAIACVVAGGGMWAYRNQRARAIPRDLSPAEIVRHAWTEGQRVSLRGSQLIQFQVRPGEALAQLKADVLLSSDGRMRIKYNSDPIKGVTVWEDQSRTYRFNPRRKRLSIAPRRESQAERAQEELELLQSNYVAKVTGVEQVAGRPAVVVELRPHSNTERWRRLAIDRESWVILRIEDRLGPKEVQRVMQYQDVDYLTSTPADPEFRPSEELLKEFGDGSREVTSRFEPEQLSKVVGFTVRMPKWVPAGYKFEGAYPIPCLCKERHQAARIEFSDGLSTLTLIEAGYPGCPAAKKGLPGNAPTLLNKFRHNGVYYLAVGDVPQQVRERVARSAAGLE